jgi:hypothetical protein
MRIFIGFGYHERDEWIEDLVFPLVRAFGFEPVSGREIYGQDLSQGVKDTIARADALIGFTTRRADQNGIHGGTHRWVTDELATAVGQIPILEVREDGITQGGIVGGRQYIPYVEAHRDKCLVEIAAALGIWKSTLPVRVKLIPDELVEEIWPNVRKPGFTCTYTVLEGYQERSGLKAKLFPITGALFVELRDVGPQALVQIAIAFGGNTWTSSFESIGTASIRLER